MAGRGALVEFLTSTSGLIIAIVIQSLALVVWNVGTRGPRELLDDIRGSLRARRVLRGCIRFAAGTLLLLGGTLLLVLELPSPASFAPVESIAVVAALLVELLIGPELRSSMRL